tara:strand:- start:198 stop:443 length:246 start_codon:yes stop_codon:yes gene_type:complete
MNSSNPNQLESEEKEPLSKESIENRAAENESSATTLDIPEFGWSGYAERVNGRFAMIGFISILAIEAISHGSFLQWAGIIN